MNVDLLQALVLELTKEFQECENNYTYTFSPMQKRMLQKLVDLESQEINTAEWYNALIAARQDFNSTLSRKQRELRSKANEARLKLKEYKIMYSFERSENLLKDLIYQDT